jgi:hypothetical protein
MGRRGGVESKEWKRRIGWDEIRGRERTHSPGPRETQDKDFHWDRAGVLRSFGVHGFDKGASKLTKVYRRKICLK